MTTRKTRWMCAASAALVLFAMALIMQSCGGGGGSGPAGGAALVAGDTSGAASGDIVKLVSGEPEAPVLQSGGPITSMAAPPCPPPQGASANNTINAYYKPDNAFDGDMNTWWVGAVGAGSWDLYYGFPNVRTMDSLNVTFYGATYVPTQVKLKVSTDGCAWTDLGAMSAGIKPSIAVGQSVRYLWVEMTGNPGTNYPLVRDIDWVQPQDNLYASGGPGANEAVYFPSNAFDGNLNTWWAGQVGAGAWDIYYMFDTPRMVQMVTAELFNINYRPTNMKLHISNDGQNWTDLGEMEPGASPHQFVGQTTQYLWIEMDGNPPSNFPLIKDVSLDIPAGASSGDSINTFYKPANAFDGNPNTWWTGAQAQTEWNLIYKYATDTFINDVSILYYADTHVPTNTTLYTSNDGDNWTIQGAFPSGATPSLSVGVTARYVRFLLTGAPTIGYPLIKDTTIDQPGVWVEMSSGSASGNGLTEVFGETFDYSIATDCGNPVLAMIVQDSSANPQFTIRVKEWNGASWVPYGGAVSSVVLGVNIVPESISVACDSMNRPYFVWNGIGPTAVGIFVSKWDGSSWQSVGPSTNGGVYGIPINSIQDIYPYGPKMGFLPNGNPLVVWNHHQTNPIKDGVYSKQWNGSAWVEAGTGSASGDGLSTGMVVKGGVIYISFDTSNNPLVIWSVGPTLSNVTGVRWDSTTWQEIIPGAAPSTDPQVYPTSFVTDQSGNMYVTYSTGGCHVCMKMWNGSQWTELGGSATSGIGSGLYPSMTFDNMNRPVVAWVGNIQQASSDIYVKKWDGANWVEMGTGSATGGGVSQTSLLSNSQKVVLGNDNRIWLFWNEILTEVFGDAPKVYGMKYIE